MNFLLTFAVPFLLAVVFHMTFVRTSAFVLRQRAVGWATCALFAFISTCLLYILRSRDLFAITDSRDGALAAAASLMLQALLGSAVIGPVLLRNSTRVGAALRGAGVASLAFFLFLAAGLSILSAIDVLAV